MADPDSGAQLARRGVPLIDPALAVTALGHALDSGEDQVTVADVDWARFAVAFTIRRPSPLIAELPEVRRAMAVAEAPAAQAGDSRSALAAELAGLSAAEQVHTLTDLIVAQAAAALGHGSAAEIEEGRAFKDLGFDSLTAVEFRDQLVRRTGLGLPATVVFDYPTPAALAEHLWAQEFQQQMTPAPLLGELDRLDSLLAQAAADDATHQLVAARLQGLSAKWSSAGVRSTTQTVVRKLESASDDEIFDFINKEFGRS